MGAENMYVYVRKRKTNSEEGMTYEKGMLMGGRLVDQCQNHEERRQMF